MQTDDYIVRLDMFEGPLDLLLHLIRRTEVEITDIPIATVADQYLAHLRGIERIDIELAGEFLVMAATLMEIKSRMLMPPEPGRAVGDDDGESDGVAADDPRAELVQQLLAYKRYRDAASTLEQRMAQWERRYPAAAAAIDMREVIENTEPDLDVEDLQLYDLVEAFGRILETVDLDRASRATHDVAYDDTPIELHAEDILDQLRRRRAAPNAANGVDADGEPRLTLRDLLSGRSRGEMIGLFLALLELLRRRSVTVMQERAGADVRIGINDDPDEAPPEEAPEDENPEPGASAQD